MGQFCTLEGGEFSGKTSSVLSIELILKEAGLPVVRTREPGGSPEAELIRQVIFAKLRNGAQASDLVIDFNQARLIHLENTVWPVTGRSKQEHGFLSYATDTWILPWYYREWRAEYL